ncbi:MAG: LuxR C-terminal-related transcriptional regulator, partial [Acidimicrobiia bacterium]|nr:LuxR C-terminal-related transcriptional regulator [Acidimicrobiia bacterium]
EEAASLIEEAADRASERGAPAIAAQLAEHSLRLTPPGMTEVTHRRAFAQIEYLAGAGEVGRALSLARELIDTMAPGPARAEALLREWDLDDDFHPTASEAHMKRALEEATGDDRLRIRILSTLGRGREYAGDLQGGIEACREALSIAEELGDPSVEMNAVALLAYLETRGGAPRWDLMDRALTLEHDLRMPVMSQSPSELMVGLLLWQGELAEARRLLAVTRHSAAEAGLDWKALQHDYGLALLECMAGNLEAANEAVLRAMTAAQDAEDPWSERVLLFPYGLIAGWLGRVDSARAAAEELIRADHGLRFASVNGHKVLGLLALAAGEWREATIQLQAASALSEGVGIRHPGVDRELPDLVEAAAFAGDLDVASTHLERLEREAATVEGPWPDAAAVRARGALLMASGEGDGAAELLGEAMARFDHLGFQPDAARSRLLQGRALARAGHRSRAAQALADAHQRFTGIGAVVWQQKTAEELERVAPGRASGILTKTEAAVAALIGEGQRNREIAEALFMSIATVEAHLTRIYRKLEIRSRSELSRLVASGDLALSDAEGGTAPGQR